MQCDSAERGLLQCEKKRQTCLSYPARRKNKSRRDDTLLTGCVSFRMQRLHLPKVPQGRHLKTGRRMIIKCRPCGT